MPDPDEIERTIRSEGDADPSAPDDGATLREPAADSPDDGATLADGGRDRVAKRYKMLGKLGQGGMGVVFKARDRKLGRVVALKRLRPETEHDQKAIKRFWTEARTIASLDDFNIVRIYNVFEEGRQLWIEMELVEGGTLQETVSQGKALPAERVCEIGIQLCSALESAHDKGVIHRDIKPSNVLLTERGSPKLADFGLAREAEDAPMHTVTGALMGTPHYASPEQMVSAKHVDHRSDLYSLGATLYALSTGREPRVIRLDSVPKGLREVLARCLEERPGKRWGSAAELRKALEALNEKSSWTVAEVGCPKCGEENPLDVRFCLSCGADLASLFEKCPKCARENRIDQQYCGGCGLNLLAYKDATKALREAEELFNQKRYEESITRAKRGCAAGARKNDLLLAIKNAEAKLARTKELRREADRLIADEKYQQAQARLSELRPLVPDPDSVSAEIQKLSDQDRDLHINAAHGALRLGKLRQAASVCESLTKQWPHDGAVKDVCCELRARRRHRKIIFAVFGVMLMVAAGVVYVAARDSTTAQSGSTNGASRSSSGGGATTPSSRKRTSPSRTPSRQTKTVDLGNGETMEFVWIEPGRFEMGSPTTESKRGADEGQRHGVTIGEGFWLGRTEVTQGQYRAVMGKNPSHFTGDDTLPVEQVSWNDAKSFCERLSRETGLSVRLPSESEWEFACRAGTTTAFNTGSTINTDQANYNGNYTYGNGRKGVYRRKTEPVGSFKPNAWGLYDMHGNVWEWCEDVWHDSYQGAPTDGSAWTRGGDQGRRVLRGGSWLNNPRNCRSAIRYRITPVITNYTRGFRVCLD